MSTATQTPTIIKVSDSSLYSKVLLFREKIYREHYPAINNAGKPDIHDFASQYFTTLNADGEVTSCSRLVPDSVQGLPSENFLEPYLAQYRQRGERVAELGRMAVGNAAPGIALAHFIQAFKVSQELGIDHIALVAPTEKSPFFTKFLGALLLADDIHESFGSRKTFAIYLWRTAAPSPRLQRKLRAQALSAGAQSQIPEFQKDTGAFYERHIPKNNF